MNNNKNNSANVAEESKNNTMLYAGIGIVAVILLIGFGYWMWGGSTKESDDSSDKEQPKTQEQIVEEVRVIIQYGFVSKGCDESIKEYNGIDTSKPKEKEASEKKLKKHLGDKKPEKIKEAYTKHADKIKELQDKMAKIIKGLDHEEAMKAKEAVVQSLKDFKVPEDGSDQMEGDSKKTTEGYIKEAIKKIKAMKTDSDKQGAIDYIGEDTNKGYCTFYLKGKALEEMKKIREALNEIDATALATTPEEGVNLEELEKVYKKWNENDYQTIVDEYHIAEALGQISTEGN